MISKEEFLALGKAGYNRIPLTVQVYSDLDTPLSTYLKLTCAPSELGGKDSSANPSSLSFLLESVVGGERFGRYSFIGLPCNTLIRANNFGSDTLVEVVKNGEVIETSKANPLDFISEYQSRFKVAPDDSLHRFCGGLAGYFGYDAVRYIEKKLAHSCPAKDEQNLPNILLLQCEELAIIDNLTDRLQLVIYVDPDEPNSYEKGIEKLAQIKAKIKRPITAPLSEKQNPTEVQRDFTQADYKKIVLKAKEQVANGDFMQVQIGQCLKKPFTGSPINLYRALRTLNPSPYMYYYNFGDFHVVGASPEILVRQEKIKTAVGIDTKITIRPLAGTRPRGANEAHDLALEKELLADPKERAEHVMLIDLARNDIGRIAKSGTIKVTESFAIERYSHVMHIVSNVEGLLKENLDAMDVFRATFPAGTLTGAPKVKAMEVIDQLELTKRNLYGGACGYLSYSGNMDIAIAIRTAVIKDNTIYVQAAAGIVADSIPEMEWKEIEAKSKALICAAELVERGFE